MDNQTEERTIRQILCDSCKNIQCACRTCRKTGELCNAVLKYLKTL